jgi:hypothetical protein
MRGKPTTFFCFSPPVMLITFALEIVFAFYTIWRYKFTSITRVIVALLFLLAIFQGTEFLLCGGFALSGGVWSKIGYSAITLLPPLGIHLAYLLANKRHRLVVAIAYLSSILFVTYFAFVTNAVSGHTCYANYVTFDTADGSTLPYSLYYYGWLLIGVFLTLRWTPRLEPPRKAALYSLMVGYLALLVPTTTVTLLWSDAMGGIPSIMCGFAIILAGILTFRVAPEGGHVRPIGQAANLRRLLP